MPPRTRSRQPTRRGRRAAGWLESEVGHAFGLSVRTAGLLHSAESCSGDDKTVLTKESSQQNRSFHTSTSTAARAWARGANLIDEGTVQAEGRRADVGMSHVESLSCAWPG